MSDKIYGNSIESYSDNSIENETSSEQKSIEQPKKKLIDIDSELFWMVFAFAACLIILYMALDFRNAVELTCPGQCAQICYEAYQNMTGFHGFNISIP